MATLALAAVGWCGLLWPSLRWQTPSILTLALFAAPVLTALAAVDIYRMGWTWVRFFAFFCSLGAFGLMLFALYQRLHYVSRV